MNHEMKPYQINPPEKSKYLILSKNSLSNQLLKQINFHMKEQSKC